MLVVDPAMFEEVQSVAREGVKNVKAYLTYQGSNPEYFKKARVGAMAMSSYTRLYATQANIAGMMLQAMQAAEVDSKVIEKTCRAIGLIPESATKR